jgi:hypothetical protein
MPPIDSRSKLLIPVCSEAAIALLLVFLLFRQIGAAVGYGWDMSGVRVKSVRQVENAAPKPSIEIELYNTKQFHIGDLNWCLQIGSFQIQRPARRSADHRSLTYVLSFDDWNRLQEGAPLYLIWGYYDAKEKGVRPFANLNKKMLKKMRSTKN